MPNAHCVPCFGNRWRALPLSTDAHASAGQLSLDASRQM